MTGNKPWPVSDRRAKGGRGASGDRRAGTERRETAGAKARDRNTASRGGAERRRGKERRSEAGWAPVPLERGSVDAEQELLAAAADVRTFAQARYSGFKVGAALETPDGRIITGCNIENATYGLTICAERVALVKALSEGQTRFTRVAVVADTDDPTPPCGACRQLLWEYCGDVDIILGNLNGPTARYKLSALLPMPFDARLLE
jgi:cytidine deaminase